MRIARLLIDGQAVLACQHADGTFTALDGHLFGALRDTGTVVSGPLLAPLDPTVVFCIGLNYRKHAEETKAEIPKHPVQHPEQPILLPRALRSDKVDYECELAVVIGKPAKNVPKEKALDYVLGYTCANDVSARDWQKDGGGGQWCRGKTFDTFLPLGPALVTADEIPNPNALRIATRVNGETLQDWSTDDMIFDIPTLIAFLSASTTLPAGAVIITGTPHGVGMARTPQRWLQSGDVAEVEIERIGVLRNPVVEESID
jgi:2-keto-4-pentenoate hydratase/2-oxohepta-3-ene-1,7-dioic acid hydratase in catechol pathway